VVLRPNKNVGQCDGSLAKQSATNVNRTEMKNGERQTLRLMRCGTVTLSEFRIGIESQVNWEECVRKTSRFK
jgi:hypothetical protein